MKNGETQRVTFAYWPYFNVLYGKIKVGMLGVL